MNVAEITEEMQKAIKNLESKPVNAIFTPGVPIGISASISLGNIVVR